MTSGVLADSLLVLTSEVFCNAGGMFHSVRQSKMMKTALSIATRLGLLSQGRRGGWACSIALGKEMKPWLLGSKLSAAEEGTKSISLTDSRISFLKEEKTVIFHLLSCPKIP